MKTPSDDLFKLIKSLTPQEKKAFKMKASVSSSEPYYVVLFDAIDRLQTYDEKILKRKIQNKKLISQLKSVKSYTHEAILNSLEDNYIRSSGSAQIRSLLNKAEILFEKKFYDIGMKMLSKAERMAAELSDNHSLLGILTMKKDYSWKCRMFPEMEKHLLNNDEEKHIGAIREYVAFQKLNMKMQLTQLKYKLTKSDFAEVRKLLSSPFLTSPPPESSYKLVSSYYFIKYGAYIILGDDEKAYENSKKWFNHMEAHPEIVEKEAAGYFISIANLMGVFIHDKYFEADKLFRNAMSIYESFSERKKDLKVKASYALMIANYLYFLCKYVRYDEAISVWEKNKKNIHMDILQVDTRFALYDNLAFAFFLINRYADALSWLNKIIHSKSDYRKDIQACSRMVAMLVYYELNDIEGLLYSTKSAERFLKKNNMLFVDEKIMLDFFRKTVIKINSKKDELQHFLILKEALSRKKGSAQELNVMAFFDFISWIDSKINNRPFEEILKEKLISTAGA